MKTKPETKHTPGPWEQNGEYIQARGPEYGHYPYRRDPLTIATVWEMADGRHNAELTGKDMANARLIAAAPDLLAALKDLLHDADIDHEGKLVCIPDCNCPREKARRAIRKAEGR